MLTYLDLAEFVISFVTPLALATAAVLHILAERATNQEKRQAAARWMIYLYVIGSAGYIVRIWLVLYVQLSLESTFV